MAMGEAQVQGAPPRTQGHCALSPAEKPGDRAEDGRGGRPNTDAEPVGLQCGEAVEAEKGGVPQEDGWS